MIKIETKRLYLRELTESDMTDLSAIMRDEQTMYAYEGAFSGEETREWLDKQLLNYGSYKYGLWAVTLRENNKMIGQCGLMRQLNLQFTGRILRTGTCLKSATCLIAIIGIRAMPPKLRNSV